jgi:hypothetical protein
LLQQYSLSVQICVARVATHANVYSCAKVANRRKDKMTVETKTNMPFGAFRCDRLASDPRGLKTVNVVLLSGHATASEAMDAANRARRADRKMLYRFFVADAQYSIDEARA